MGWQWGQGPWKGSPYVQVSDVLCYKPIPISKFACLKVEWMLEILKTTVYYSFSMSELSSKTSILYSTLI